MFNFLLENKETLGIKTLMRFNNLLVDGAIELSNEKRLAVEIKFRMNWEKACQAEWQFSNFLKRSRGKDDTVNGGIVFFEEFTADWKRQAKCRFLENGWSHWYRGHSEVEDLRLDLVRIRKGKDGKIALEGFPIVNAMVAHCEDLSDEDKNRVLDAIGALHAS